VIDPPGDIKAAEQDKLATIQLAEGKREAEIKIAEGKAKVVCPRVSLDTQLGDNVPRIEVLKSKEM
jgi:hypothetical protein